MSPGIAPFVLLTLRGSVGDAQQTSMLWVAPAGDNSSITREKLELMLEAARWAPTHKLTEPWHFVVIGGEHKAAFEVS